MVAIVYFTALALCTGYALLRGGSPERAGAILLLAAVAASVTVEALASARFLTVDGAMLAVDAAFFASLVVLSVTANRYWPLAMVALKGFSLLVHVAKGIAPQDVSPKVYAVAVMFSAFPNLLVLAIATARHRTRVRLNGTDPSWSNWFGPSRSTTRERYPGG